MIDKRLLGTWKSDTRRTMKEIRNQRDIKKVRAENLKKMFGKLNLRYTRTRIYADFKGDKSVVPYQVIAKDDYSVVVKEWDEVFEENRLHHIHFEGKYYWIWEWLGGFREFFKKID